MTLHLVEIGKELFRLLAYMLPSMFIGLYLANVLGKSGQLKRVGALMAPLSNAAKLPKGCSSVLTFCVLNKETGFSMLSALNRNNGLSDRAVVIISMLANLPLCIRSIVFFIAPVSFSMLGMHVGGVFTFVYFCLHLLKAMVGVFAGRLMLTSGEKILEIDEETKDHEFLGWAILLRSSARDTLEPFMRILKLVIPSLLIAILLINSGILSGLSHLHSPLTHLLNLPSSSGLVIVSGWASMMVGIATAGPLVINGAITPLEAIGTLVITSLIHNVYTLLRMSLPVNISLFGPKLGGIITGVAGLMELIALSVFALLGSVG
jgi:hypothetical protein